MRIIPAEYMRHAHHWLILHGRYVCKARKPECPRCVIADICKAAEKTNDDPGAAGRTAAAARDGGRSGSVAEAARHHGGEDEDQREEGDLAP